MVATLLFMPTENDPPPLCAPPQPSHEDVLNAQKDALAAQQIALQFPGSRVEAYALDIEPLKPWDILAEMGLQTLTQNVP